MAGAASPVPAIPTMPHMSASLLCLLHRFAGAKLGGPAGYFLLLRPGEGECILRDLPCDHAARADIGAIFDLHRRNQRGIRANKCACSDLGPMLVEAVVIAGDGAGADVCSGTHARIAQIGEV